MIILQQTRKIITIYFVEVTMKINKEIPLTAAEIASLWTSYMNDSMSKCILGYLLKHIKDKEIKPAIRFAFDLSSNHLNQLHTFLIKNNMQSQMGLLIKMLIWMPHGCFPTYSV